jgi:DNA-binding CsgD family transcriptional regulator
MRSTRMVGRDGELALISNMAVEARQGVPRLLVVDGEAGIGKSRLVAEAVAALGHPSDLVATGHCAALVGHAIPFGVVNDLVRDVARQRGPDVVADAVAALGTSSRADVLDTVTALVEGLAADRLCWLVVEDVHWADGSSLELFDYLVHVVAASRLFVLITRRTHDQPPSAGLERFVTELVRRPHGDRLELERLGADEVREQVADILASEPRPEVVARAVALGQGNPFLTEEVVAAPTAGPGSLGRSMLSRVSELSVEGQQLVRAAALDEGHLTHDLVARVLGSDPAVTAEAAAEAVAAHVLEVDDSGRGYRFRHALLREAVSESLLPAGRQAGHRRWAEELAADPAPWGVLEGTIAAAHHWYESDDLPAAFTGAVQAVDAAERLQAAEEHLQLDLRVLELWPRVEDPRGLATHQRIDFAWDAFAAVGSCQAWEAGLALAERELDHPDAAADPVWRVNLQLERTGCLQQLGRDIDWSPLVEQVDVLLSMVPEEGNNLLSRTLVACQGDLWWAGWVEEADRLLARATEMSRQNLDHVRVVDANPDYVRNAVETAWLVDAALAERAWRDGRTNDAIDTMARLCSEAAGAGYPGWVTRRMPTVLSSMLTMAGRSREALVHARRAFDQGDHPRLSRGDAFHAVEALWEAHFDLGEWDEAHEWLDLAADLGVTGIQSGLRHLAQCRLSCLRGDPRRAEVALDEASVHLWRTATPVVPPRLRTWSRVLLVHSQGRTREALELVSSALADRPRFPDELEWPELLLAARVVADAGTPDPEPWVQRLRSAAGDVHRHGAAGAAWSAHLEAELLRLTGSTDPDPWEEAVEAWSRVERRHEQAWSLLRLGESRLRRHDRAGAWEPLRAALEIARRLRAAPLVTAVTGVARSARLDVGLDPPDPRALPLTERETEVLRLVADGRTNGEIARALFISPKTASVHVSHILTKLGVHTRTEAAVVAHRHAQSTSV